MNSTQCLRRTRVVQIDLENDIVSKKNSSLDANRRYESQENLRPNNKFNFENLYSSPYSNKNENVSVGAILKEYNHVSTPSMAKKGISVEVGKFKCSEKASSPIKSLNEICDEVLAKSKRIVNKGRDITPSNKEENRKFFSRESMRNSNRLTGKIKRQGTNSFDSPHHRIDSTLFPIFSPMISPESKEKKQSEFVSSEEKPFFPMKNIDFPLNNEISSDKLVFELKFYSLEFNDSINTIQRAKGKSTVYYSSGMKYKGEIKNESPNGFGELFDKYGNIVYCGQWSEGKIHGNGFLKNTLSNKNTLLSFDHSNLYSLSSKWLSLEGKFLKGVAHGKCKLTLVNGDSLDSVFTSGKANGKSVWKLKAKDLHCIFSENKLVMKLNSN